MGISLFLLEQILSSSPHPHLLDDLLVETGSLILQFASSSLCEWVATLKQRNKRVSIIYCKENKSVSLNQNIILCPFPLYMPTSQLWLPQQKTFKQLVCSFRDKIFWYGFVIWSSQKFTFLDFLKNILCFYFLSLM